MSLRFLLVAVTLTVVAGSAAANAATSNETFDRSVTALHRGSWSEAIDDLETLADRGFVHPDASFNRAVAYAGRASTPQARPGDLGQAAAGLTETLLLRPGDGAAEQALDRVRSEIARARARAGADPVVVRPSLDRAILALADETVWNLGALLGALLLTAGLATRTWLDRSSVRLGGGIAASIGAVALLAFGALSVGARHVRIHTKPAVVVIGEARILDEDGTPTARGDADLDLSSIPEGASLEVHERKGRLVHFRWGTHEGWVQASQVRILTRPDDL